MPDSLKCLGQKEPRTKTQHTHQMCQWGKNALGKRPAQRARVHSSGPVPERQYTSSDDEDEMPFYQDFDDTAGNCFIMMK